MAPEDSEVEGDDVWEEREDVVWEEREEDAVAEPDDCWIRIQSSSSVQFTVVLLEDAEVWVSVSPVGTWNLSWVLLNESEKVRENCSAEEGRASWVGQEGRKGITLTLASSNMYQQQEVQDR
jgi:hypothetical protein